MNLDIWLFWVFSICTLITAIMVVNTLNAVHSVLFLILTFFNITCLLLLCGAEFFAFLLLIVYVGAIAVLFLFVVMMLNVKIKPRTFSFFSILPIGSIIFLILIYQFYIAFFEFDLLHLNIINLNYTIWFVESKNITNIQVIGHVLYTKYSLLFIISSCILLVAMIGTIVLTMHQKQNLKIQQIEFQLLRNPKNAIKFINLRV